MAGYATNGPGERPAPRGARHHPGQPVRRAL